MNKQNYNEAYSLIKKAIYEYCDSLHDIIFFSYKITGKLDQKAYKRWVELERMATEL